jgi:hypothetical protein
LEVREKYHSKVIMSPAPFVILTKRASRAEKRTSNSVAFLCHPDDARNASGRTWLLASGQLRAREAGSGFEIAQRSLSDVVARLPDSHRMQQRTT